MLETLESLRASLSSSARHVRPCRFVSHSLGYCEPTQYLVAQESQLMQRVARTAGSRRAGQANRR